ncbi:flagellar basal-body rod modification protein FlgD [Limimonas halophila]|uniref:Basal-body rod modification protein FlgD n=1 Tax=Limimonas halophila TaxID=1082479 RepID=A0A1G7M6S6_9PROT|nr:FlgD immunoglobulin-like domain containing protein [Limimonas halophila]SDF56880.1 flagellar basal-body rod modification protein FlgD [Limimonas halophila]
MDASGIISGQQGNALNLGGQNASDGSRELVDNFQTFVDLLTTQLQNQNPTDPSDPSKFTRQLVNFSQVEQALATNEKLDQVIQGQENNAAASAANFIGQRAEASSDKVQLSDGEATIGYELSSEAAAAQIEITNSDGDVVRTLDAETAAGSHEVTWNGENAAGEALPEGAYNVNVVAEDVAGNSVETSTRAIGEITGFERTGDGVVLKMGSVEVGFDELQSVG